MLLPEQDLVFPRADPPPATKFVAGSLVQERRCRKKGFLTCAQQTAMNSARWIDLTTGSKASSKAAPIVCRNNWQADKFAVSESLSSIEATVFSVRIHVDGSSGNWKARIGIMSKSSDRTFFLHLQAYKGCCSERSCIPASDCPSAGDTAKLQWDPAQRKLKLMVDGGQFYAVHTVSSGDEGPFKIVAELEGTTALSLSRLVVETSSQAYRREATAKGATLMTGEDDAGDNGSWKCNTGAVRCGDGCSGLCKFCGPPRYCM